MIRFRHLLRGCAAVLLLPAALATPLHAASLTVAVTGVRNGSGHVRIGVCTQSQFLGERCSYHAIVTSRQGTVTVTIPGIQPGAYAIAAYQDETDVGHLRRGLFGIPKDGTGFSRNPFPGMGPPSFQSCALSIGHRDAAISIALHYF